MKNRGIARGRIFMGTLLLVAAVMTWFLAIWMSPHGEAGPGGEALKPGVIAFIRNSAIGTLLMSALAAYLLFPERRPVKPIRDWVIRGIIGVMVAVSLYQLIWLYLGVLR